MVRRKSKTLRGFTLVELLVVIGIIALLIAMLLPVLGKARAQAQLVQCQSNIRQLITASLLFANDHQRRIPTCADNQWVFANDTVPQTYFAYRPNPPGGPNSALAEDWASSLTPYLGQGLGGSTYEISPSGQTKVFQCPSDVWQNLSYNSAQASFLNPGYRMINNVTETYLPISYGINADITMLTSPNGGFTVFTPPPPTSTLYEYYVFAGPTNNSEIVGAPMCCKIDRVYKPAETLLFADCGNRPLQGTYSYPLDPCDCLEYTTNFSILAPHPGGRMSNIATANWLGNRIPLAKAPYNYSRIDRHLGGLMNIGFCDGHVESLGYGDLNRVRISPWQY